MVDDGRFAFALEAAIATAPLERRTVADAKGISSKRTTSSQARRLRVVAPAMIAAPTLVAAACGELPGCCRREAETLSHCLACRRMGLAR
jgi:hypothetical protein